MLLDADGRARLTDFGIAQPRDATSLYPTGQVIGTESYLAPEVLGGAPATERSDLYALGVVLAEVARSTGADASLWELIESLRAEDPAERRPRRGAALKALQRLTRPTAVVAKTTEPFEIESAPPRRPPGDRLHGAALVRADAAARRRSSDHNGRRIAIGALAAVIVGDRGRCRARLLRWR